MGKVIFDKIQEIVFSEFSQNNALREKFYFTGGTALSVFYLNHRISQDLDFFSEKNFENELVTAFVRNLAQKYDLEERFTQIEQMRIFNLLKEGVEVAKIDFVYYPFKRLKQGERQAGVEIDSLTDIAVNKLISINQRTDVKDFVDLYFLKDQFVVWDLIVGVKTKFGFELDPILLASDFMKVEEFDFLPKMLLPLKISDLQAYFKKEAKGLGKKFTDQ